MKDVQNSLIRKGIGKGRTKGNFGKAINQYKDVVRVASWSNEVMSTMQRGESQPTRIYCNVAQEDSHGHTKTSAGAVERLTATRDTEYQFGRMPGHEAAEIEAMAPDVNAWREMMSRTYGGEEGNYLSPGNHDDYDPRAPYAGYEEMKHQASKDLYDAEDDHIA